MTCKYGRKFLLIVISAALSGAMLTGCTSSQSSNLQGYNSTSASSGSAGQAASGAQSADPSASGQDASGQAASGQAASGQDASAQASGQAVSGQDASAQEQAASGQASGGSSAQSVDGQGIATYDEEHQNGDDLPGSVYDADEEEAAEMRENFTGSFSKADDSESVTLNFSNDTAVDFSFRVSGIHGSAVVDGSKAVYTGDDDYTITFTPSQSSLTVEVGGDDAASSPLNGTYERDIETEG